MKKFVMAALGGTVAGVVLSTQIAAPLLADEAAKPGSVYEQLNLFGDIFERIRTDYVEQVDDKLGDAPGAGAGAGGLVLAGQVRDRVGK